MGFNLPTGYKCLLPYHVVEWAIQALTAPLRQIMYILWILLIYKSGLNRYNTLSFYGSTALVDLGHFSFLTYTQSVELLGQGMSPSQGKDSSCLKPCGQDIRHMLHVILHTSGNAFNYVH
jgi:hypothetical protein